MLKPSKFKSNQGHVAEMLFLRKIPPTTKREILRLKTKITILLSHYSPWEQTSVVNHREVASSSSDTHPDSELPNISSCSQGLRRPLLGHFCDEVLGSAGGLCLESCPDCSGDLSVLILYIFLRIIDHAYSHIVTGFLFTK